MRFDGGHKRDRYLTDTLGQFFEWVSVCPKVEMGLSTPRETLRLVGDPAAPRLVFGKTRGDVHHLAIGRNVPLGAISQMLARLGRWLVIEFVPKDDPQVVRLLRWREDVFADYTEEHFREEFARDFECVSRVALPDSGWSVNLMNRR